MEHIASEKYKELKELVECKTWSALIGASKLPCSYIFDDYSLLPPSQNKCRLRFLKNNFN